jgi:mRNA-degrading endonuclease RelE of RelBE toxin-antitoxin system
MRKYIVATTPKFEGSFKKLKKSYPRMKKDFDEFLDEIEEDGDLGEDIPGVVKDGNKVFKKRMRNSSANKGLSGGFRIIEYLVTSDNVVFLLDIYSKNDVDNITAKEIRKQLVEPNRALMEEILKELRDEYDT